MKHMPVLGRTIRHNTINILFLKFNHIQPFQCLPRFFSGEKRHLPRAFGCVPLIVSAEELAYEDAAGVESLPYLLKNGIELLAGQEGQAEMRVDEVVVLKLEIYKRGLYGAQSLLVWESCQNSHRVRIGIDRRDLEALGE